MNHLSQATRPGLILLVTLSLVLSGCLSLSEDITPPPGNAQPTLAPATQAPRPTVGPTSTSGEPQPTQAEDSSGGSGGVVTVEISDQTGGSLLSEDLQVLLEGYDQFDVIYQVSQSAKNSPQVVFSEVPLQPGRIFFASISYGGAVYRSEIVEIGQDTSVLDLLVPVYETTPDGSGLIIDRVHVLLEVLQPELLNVVEIYIFSNLGNATLIAPSPGEPAVIFPLPAEAGSIEFDDGVLGGRYLLTEDGFGDTVSIPPGIGVYQVLVYYTLPYQGRKLDFQQTMAYPVDAVVVMTPADNIQVKGSTLVDLGLQEIPSGAVQVYSGSSLASGEKLEFQISGKPQDTSRQTGSSSGLSQILLISVGAAGGVLFLVGVVLFLRNRRENGPSDSQPASEIERERILDSIIALEDLFQNGEITEKTYQKKRQELKDQLSSLVD